MRVGQESNGQPTVQIEQFAMDAELAPFLSGEALIFDMRVVNPKLRLRLLKDGTLDWMRGSRPEIPAKTVVLESVHVTGGDVQFIDDQSGRARSITGLNAEMSARSLAGPWRIEGDAALDGEHGSFSISSGQPDETGALQVRTQLIPDQRPVKIDLDGQLKLADRKPNYQGLMSAAVENRGAAKSDDKNALPPRLKGRFELTNERIRLSEYRMEIGSVDDPYVITGEATLDTGNAPEFLLIADGQQIDVNRIGNQGAGGKTARDPGLSARQRLNSLISIIAQIPVPQVQGKASVKLPAIVAGDTTIRDVQLDLQPAGNGWTMTMPSDAARAHPGGGPGPADAKGRPFLQRADYRCLQSALGACLLACGFGRPRDPSIEAGGLFRRCQPDASAAALQQSGDCHRPRYAEGQAGTASAGEPAAPAERRPCRRCDRPRCAEGADGSVHGAGRRRKCARPQDYGTAEGG
ncbi:hypothetical protein AJ87_29110 [Rhizobium yanglingense]|nr:hypothetical protein AJ87_29110 [Rhizobium yanglingense]